MSNTLENSMPTTFATSYFNTVKSPRIGQALANPASILSGTKKSHLPPLHQELHQKSSPQMGSPNPQETATLAPLSYAHHLRCQTVILIQTQHSPTYQLIRHPPCKIHNRGPPILHPRRQQQTTCRPQRHWLQTRLSHQTHQQRNQPTPRLHRHPP